MRSAVPRHSCRAGTSVARSAPNESGGSGGDPRTGATTAEYVLIGIARFLAGASRCGLLVVDFAAQHTGGVSAGAEAQQEHGQASCPWHPVATEFEMHQRPTSW